MTSESASSAGDGVPTGQAPETFRVAFSCSCGDFVIECRREWAPLGVDRFYSLVQQGFYDDCRFFRVLPNFVVQFGISGDPSVSRVWSQKRIADDPVTQSNTEGMVTFAMAGPNTRTTQLFINLGNNRNLDKMQFSPIGKVVSGMEVVKKMNATYGEAPSNSQGNIQAQGNVFLDAKFPNLDYIKKAVVVA